MILLDRINAAASDTDSLDKFLSKNASEITDWLNKLPHSELLTLENQFRNFVLLKIDIWKKLPKTDNNLAFLTLLLEKVEQLGDTGAFGRLFYEISKASYDLGSRLKAASLYLAKQATNADQYLAQYAPLYQLLTEAALNEDDNPDKALSTLIHYYLLAIEAFSQFNPDIPLNIKRFIEESMMGDTYSFLHCTLMSNVLAVSLIDHERASQEIHNLLDNYLNRAQPVLGVETELLVEDGTEYCGLLEDVAPNFDKIRDISVMKHQANQRREAVFSSLNRGTKIIDSEEQLYGYMYSYGQMHSEKLLSAFEKINFKEVEEPITVIDWGAGQGTATMMLFDYLNKEVINLEIQKVILIEPSKLALKRGGRHSLKFDESTALDTINKPLDSLVSGDFKVADGTVIHLFSNILDVNEVSLENLVNLIKAAFSGENYFICCSPHITPTKTQRLNIFKNSFLHNDLKTIYEVNNTAGQWKKQWTRAIRAFKTTL